MPRAELCFENASWLLKGTVKMHDYRSAAHRTPLWGLLFPSVTDLVGSNCRHLHKQSRHFGHNRLVKSNQPEVHRIPGFVHTDYSV